MTSPPNVAPRWRDRLLSELDDADARAIAVAKRLTPVQLNWRPSPGAWSVAQCLEHLALANEVYVDAMATSLAGATPSRVDDIAPGWLGRWFIRAYIEPSSRTRKRRAPGKITPPAQIDPAILERFLKSNGRARDLVRRAADYDVNRVRFRNPFVPLLRFTVGTGLEILSKHERRHLLQAEAVSASMSSVDVR